MMEEYTKRKRNQSTLEEAIEKFLQATRLKSKMRKIEVLNAWGEVLGKPVANRTEKIFLRGKTLVVVMNSSVMRDELSHGKSKIISLINTHLNDECIEDIWFQ